MGYQGLEKKNRLAKFIQKRLEDIDIFPDSDWNELDAAGRELDHLANDPGCYASDSLEMEITSPDDNAQVIFAAYRGSVDTLRECVERRYVDLLQRVQPRKLHLCFIVHSMKEQVMVENHMVSQNMRQYLRKAAPASARGNPKSTFGYIYILLQEYSGKEKAIDLTGIVRHEILREPPVDGSVNLEKAEPEAPDVQAAVCTVNLYQIVKIYNETGDQLFHNNVRFGIPNLAGVEQAITRTLESEPGHFFFKNNGISILAENPQVYSLEPERFTLGRITDKQVPDFSVVNGAQTITVAAKYFFRLEYLIDNGKASPEQMEQYENTKEKARVQVRIMRIRQTGKPQSPSLAGQISVALNRQKPIKIEDIAYTDFTVQKLADYLQDNPGNLSGVFRLIRRGEETESSKELLLQDFIRARLACAGQPGTARGSGADSILQFQNPMDGKRPQRYSIIFPEKWIDAESEDEKTAAYKQYYQAIWFIHELAGSYHEARNKITSTSRNIPSTVEGDVLTAMQNGKWYFAAAVTHIFNRFRSNYGDSPDYTDFAYDSIELLTLHSNLSQAILLFARIAVQIAAEKRVLVNANTFKSDALYKEIVKALPEGESAQYSSDIRRNVTELHKLLLQGQTSELLAVPPQDNDMAGKDYVVLNGEKREVASGARAITAIAEYILNRTEVPVEEILPLCADWLTDKEEILVSREKYFRTLHQFQAEGKTYWVGTHTNNSRKEKQVEELCSAAAVDKGEIGWYSWNEQRKNHTERIKPRLNEK